MTRTSGYPSQQTRIYLFGAKIEENQCFADPMCKASLRQNPDKNTLKRQKKRHKKFWIRHFGRLPVSGSPRFLAPGTGHMVTG